MLIGNTKIKATHSCGKKKDSKINSTLIGYFGEVDHLIPWQIDHLFSWRPKAKNAVEAVQN
jgi:hypothetical protein